jgi:hypothetical protein
MFLESPVPPVPDDPSAVSLLSKDCLRRFHHICDVLPALKPSENEYQVPDYDRDHALLTMQDARTRFKAWGESIAAFHPGSVRTSLDSRLREAPEVRGRALQILEYLQEYLHEGE